jgi:hypothetical protein
MTADDLIEERVPKKPKPDDRRVRERAATLAEEESAEGVKDPEVATEVLLEESDARTETDPAPKDLREDRVERRTSEDATPPPDSG